MSAASRVSYRFGPLERRGILGPVRAGQAAVVAAGALFAIAALDASPTATGALAGTVAFTASVIAVVAPVGGRTLDEWVPVATAFALGKASGRSRFRSPLPLRGAAGDPVPPPNLK